MDNQKTQYALASDVKVLRKDVDAIKKQVVDINKQIGDINKRMVVKDDLKKFATKDDLKNFATKDDLKNFATKDDLKNFATKDDLKNFATKDDLKNLATKDGVERIALATQKNEADIRQIKETMSTKEDVRRIMDHIDHFANRVIVFDRKVLVHDYRINELEPKVENHEKRLSALEADR